MRKPVPNKGRPLRNKGTGFRTEGMGVQSWGKELAEQGVQITDFGAQIYGEKGMGSRSKGLPICGVTVRVYKIRSRRLQQQVENGILGCSRGTQGYSRVLRGTQGTCAGPSVENVTSLRDHRKQTNSTAKLDKQTNKQINHHTNNQANPDERTFREDSRPHQKPANGRSRCATAQRRPRSPAGTARGDSP
jgi:hypothetical protein